MGSSQSKARSPGSNGHSSPQIHSPRHSSISGRVRIDSPKIGRSPIRSHGSLNRLAPKSPGGKGNGLFVTNEQTPLVIKATAPPPQEARMLSAEDVVTVGSPPLAVWIGPALACALAYALYNIFIKKGSASINPILGGVILQFVAALLGCLLLSCVVYYNKLKSEYDIDYDDDSLEEESILMMWDWVGVKWAVLAGVAVGAAEIISFCVSGMGVQAMQSIPIIIGGSVMFGTVLGFLALGETLTMRGWSGVLMISIGIALVGMDDQGEGI